MNTDTYTTIYFFVPDDGSDYAARADSRVRLIDYDEVTMTRRVEFADGFRAVVRDAEIVRRTV